MRIFGHNDLWFRDDTNIRLWYRRYSLKAVDIRAWNTKRMRNRQESNKSPIPFSSEKNASRLLLPGEKQILVLITTFTWDRLSRIRQTDLPHPERKLTRVRIHLNVQIYSRGLSGHSNSQATPSHPKPLVYKLYDSAIRVVICLESWKHSLFTCNQIRCWQGPDKDVWDGNGKTQGH